MTHRSTAALASIMAILAGCSTVADLPERPLASAVLSRGDGMPAGSAQVVANGTSVTLIVALAALPAGEHGIHLHTTGSCAAPDFASAGGHLNPLGRKHGALAPDGRHVGDLPNIAIKSNGTGTLSADLGGTPDQARAWLFDADGTAIVVHADPDDHRTDPSGNSGKRIACGVFKPA